VKQRAATVCVCVCVCVCARARGRSVGTVRWKLVDKLLPPFTALVNWTIDDLIYLLMGRLSLYSNHNI